MHAVGPVSYCGYLVRHIKGVWVRLTSTCYDHYDVHACGYIRQHAAVENGGEKYYFVRRMIPETNIKGDESTAGLWRGRVPKAREREN